jgi:hypothetical protein
MHDLSASLALLTSPAIPFFFLGTAAALARSDLSTPEPVAKALSLYLMLCIGFKGGIEARGGAERRFPVSGRHPRGAQRPDAACRLRHSQADPKTDTSFFVTRSLAITFPFNLPLGIAL